MYPFNDLVFIGRFQPFHLAHLQTVEIALQQSENVILALGSAQPERTAKNPFLIEEREQMILSNFSLSQQKRIKFIHLIDVYDDVRWVKLVKDEVNHVTESSSRIGMIGHFKDDSSYYLKLFPNWKLVELESLEHSISATPIRDAYLKGTIQRQFLPQGTIQFLEAFKTSLAYAELTKN